MKPHEIILSSGKKIFLGKNAETNDELVKEFEGKDNIIMHTVVPGSPFCIIEELKPTKKDIREVAIICASKSQDWRDNKGNVFIHQFTGKGVYKNKSMKRGTWGLKSKPKKIKVLKKEIKRWLLKNSR
jgi:predicted ribosome quality control (RQC) complex YloA/Tae2 family protein